MKNKTLRILSLVSMGLVALSSCSSSSTGEIGIFIYDSSDTFMGSLVDYLTNTLSLNKISYEPVFDAGRSQTTQNEDFIDFLNESSSKAMLVNTVDRLASSALIEKAETKNKPIIFINREPLEEDLARDSWSKKNCYYVGADSAYEGTLQATIADRFFGGATNFANSVYDKNKDGKVQVLVFKGELGHQDAEARTKNSLAGLTNAGYTYDLTSTIYCNWERSKAKEEMANIDVDKVELLLCNNDDMALGAIDNLLIRDRVQTTENLKKSFSERYFPIVGVDATASGKEAVENSYLTGTVLNDASKQSNVVVDLLNYLINEKDFPIYDSGVRVSENMYYVRGSIVKKNN
jgi:methyl-galactoside transport system substrate-binding protein